MTEQPLLPHRGETPLTSDATSKPPQQRAFAWLYALGFVLLAAAIIYVWLNPPVAPETAANTATLQSIDQRVTDIDGRVSRLEQRPNMDQRLADTDTRLGRLEQRPTPDIGKITARIDGMEARLADQTRLASRLDEISGRIESLSARDKAALDLVKQRTDALTARMAAVETASGNVDSLTKRLNRLARLQEASLALTSGQPVGDIPGAPDAIARYAHAPPPTEAGLKLSFPGVEQAALAAQQSDANDAPLGDRIWDRAQGLVTIRRGDEVIVGNTPSTILSRAQTAIDAGDLAGAVQALDALNGPPGRAIAKWLADAKALLSARSALAAMAGQA